MRVLVSIVTLIVVLIALTLLVNAMKRSTLFFPSQFPEGRWETAHLPVPPVDVRIPVKLEIDLHGWLFRAPDPQAPLIIWSHGNGGNITNRAPVASELARLGASVLLYDYRGYGKSGGQPGELILYDDALAVYDFAVRNRFGNPSSMISYGESLGGPYAAYMASKRPMRAVIIENSFHSAASLANAIYRLPVGVFLGSSLSTARFLNRANVPVLIMHGRNDEVIPIRAALDLHEALKVPKELWLVEQARHGELSTVDGYYQKVIEFSRRDSALRQ